VILDLSLSIFEVGKQKYRLLVIFYVITAGIIDIFLFWVVTSCNFVGVYGFFGGKHASIYRDEVRITETDAFRPAPSADFCCLGIELCFALSTKL
jgi:hypothetical protein